MQTKADHGEEAQLLTFDSAAAQSGKAKVQLLSHDAVDKGIMRQSHLKTLKILFQQLGTEMDACSMMMMMRLCHWSQMKTWWTIHMKNFSISHVALTLRRRCMFMRCRAKSKLIELTASQKLNEYLHRQEPPKFYGRNVTT